MTCRTEPASSAAMNSPSATCKLSKLAPTQHQRNFPVDTFSTLTVLGRGLNDNRAVLHGMFSSVHVNTTLSDISIAVVLCSSLLHSAAGVNQRNAIHHPSHSPPLAQHHSLLARASEERIQDNSHQIGSTDSLMPLLNLLSFRVSLEMEPMLMEQMECRTGH